jgi:predicted aspartyl protease
MRIEGRWLAGADGVERPVFDGYLAAPGGVQIAVSFLIDTGADFTVLAPDVAHEFAGVVAATATRTLAAGVGGTQQVYELAVDVLLPTTSGQRARIRGPLPILLTPGSLEVSVIGRDVLDQFTLIYARSQGTLLLLTPPDTFLLRS